MSALGCHQGQRGRLAGFTEFCVSRQAVSDAQGLIRLGARLGPRAEIGLLHGRIRGDVGANKVCHQSELSRVIFKSVFHAKASENNRLKEVQTNAGFGFEPPTEI